MAVHRLVQIGFVPNLQSSCKSARFPSGGDQFLVKLKPAKTIKKQWDLARSSGDLVKSDEISAKSGGVITWSGASLLV